MRSAQRWLFPLTLVLLLVFPEMASAGVMLIWDGFTSGSARDENGPNIWVSGLKEYDNGLHSLHGQGSGDFGIHGFADVFGRADFGVLHATAGAAAFVNGNAGGGLSVEFDDIITITSPTLAPGTLVNLMFTTSMHDSLFATFPTAGFPPEAIDLFRAVGHADAIIDDSLLSPAPSHSASFRFAAHVGDRVDILGRLTVIAPAYMLVNGADAAGFGSADAGNTALFFIDSLTPGASFVSDSGASYAAPAAGGTVPEPGSMTIFATGLAGLIAARIRRRR